MKVKEIIRLIEKNGWRFDRQKGSHRQYKHLLKKGVVTVSGKASDELRKGTEINILKQAGLW